MDYDYWVKLSNGTRLAKNAAENIRNGVEIYQVSNDGFFSASKDLVLGAKFPPMIFVSNFVKDYYVVLEGHLRLTAYMIEQHYIPEKVEVIVG